VINLFDTGFLHVLFDPNARVPHDAAKTGPIVDRAQDRIDNLVQVMSQRQDKIIIPAPALAEFMLLAADRRIEYLTLLRRKAVFEVAGFDDPEAVELVEYSLRISPTKKLKARSPETWAKLNYDRQIIAIAITRRVEAIYSMDNGVHHLASLVGIKSYGLVDLPLPPPVQMSLHESSPTGEATAPPQEGNGA
jgi:predicted nucleic acid-binding protein